MSVQMREQPFDLELRQFLAWHAGDVAGTPTASEVAQRISARTSRPTTFGWSSRKLQWVALVALLLVAAVGAVVAAALILRQDDPPIVVPVQPSPTLEASPSPSAQTGTLTVADDPFGNWCGQMVPDELVVDLAEGSGEPGTDRFVRVTADGTVLSGSRSGVTFDAGYSRRRLNESGMAELAALVEAANLPRCQAVVVGDADVGGQLIVQMDGIHKQVWSNGSRSRNVRPAVAAETAAFLQLSGQVKDLGAAIHPAGWRDPTWTGYVSQRWLLLLNAGTPSPLCGLDQSSSVPATRVCLQWAAGYEVPDGTPLLSFGTYYERGSDNPPDGYRCGSIDLATAVAIKDSLGLTPGERYPYVRTLVSDGGYEELRIELVDLLPGDRGCEHFYGAVEPTETAPPDLAPAIDACAVILAGVPDAGTPSSLFGAMTTGGDGWWTRCITGNVDPGDLYLWVRGRATSAADAQSYVTSLFGEGITSEVIRGRTVYWNDCFPWDPNGCAPAVAVVSEPHLLVFIWLAQTRDGFRSMLADAIEADVFP